MKLSREELNKVTEKILNDHLAKRGVNTKIYYFGICERTITNKSAYTTQTITHYHLGLYKWDGIIGGEQVEKLIDLDIIDEADYSIVNYAIGRVDIDINNGKFDKYVADKFDLEDDFLNDILDCVKKGGF